MPESSLVNVLLFTSILALVVSLLAALLSGLLLVWLRRSREETRQEVESARRLNEYLHDLNELFGTQAREGVVQRAILGGAKDVLQASHGALYRVHEEASGGQKTRRLVPLRVDRDMPPLVTLDSEALTRSQQCPLDARALESLKLLSGESWGEGLLGQAILSQQPVFIADLGEREELAAFPASLRDGWSVVLAPMHIGDEAIGLLVLASSPASPPFSEREERLAQSVAEQAAYALKSSAMHQAEAERKALRADLKRAAEVQRVLVPQQLPSPKGWQMILEAHPFGLLSGDFHDLIATTASKQPVLVVADVSGKGLGSAMLGSMTRSSLQVAVAEHELLAQALTQVNALLYPDIREDMHVTLIAAELAETGEIDLLRAGHEAALLYRAETGEVEELIPPGLSLGIDPGLVFGRITRSQQLQAQTGDLLFIYTDGLSESINNAGEEFGTERILQVIKEHGSQGAQATQQALQKVHQEFRQDQALGDDLTLVFLEKE